MIISRAPLRISFFGGGSDFPEFFNSESGAVLASAIDKFSYVTASPFHSGLFDYKLRVSYSKGEQVKCLDEIQHPVFRECLRYCNLESDIELHTVADLPSFTGLGSSSSFTVALLNTLYAYQGKNISPLQLAYDSIYIERKILKEWVGIQDQVTAAIGGFNLLEFFAEDDVRVHPIPIELNRIQELEAHIFLLFTGIKRSAQSIERQKIQRIDGLTKSLTSIKKMAYKGLDLLTCNHSLEGFGLLLHQAWIEKKQLADVVSNQEINRLYNQGLEAGAWGGKLLGAGGGGFILFIAPPEAHKQLVHEFTGYQVVACKLNAPGAEVIYSNRDKTND
jgi:D-glycero-alpha-D-manno-heptose-7-phosphate kinase